MSMDIKDVLAGIANQVRIPEHLLREQPEKEVEASVSENLLDEDCSVEQPSLPVEEVPEEPPLPAYITQHVYAEKNSHMSVWRNNDSVRIQIKTLMGRSYYGELSGMIAAEARLPRGNDPETRAFNKKVFDDLICAARLAPTRLDDANYTHSATVLWDDARCEGAVVPNAFLVLLWNGSGHNQYPLGAALFDGHVVRDFKLERATVTKPGQPHYTGYAR